jgi:metal-responsive CopG/Arc/MetJ family transcriptional regulator
MKKTTLYLPEELKARIERVAKETQRSEAEVIRTAIDEYTNGAARPQPRSGLFQSLDEPITDWDAALRGFGED